MFMMILALLFTLTACQSEKGKNQKGEVSVSTKEVLQAMMTGPDSDLLFVPAAIGEGTEITEEDARKQNDAVMNAWKDKVGKYFSETGIEKFLASGPATTYLQEAEQEEKSVKIKNIALEEKSEYTEKVRVKYYIGDQEKETVLMFERNAEGKIDTVRIADS